MKTDRQKEIEDFATQRHADQKYGDQPYSEHLKEVAQVVRRFGYEFKPAELELLLEGAFLHDTLEDTQTTREELTELFGVELSDLVYAVSDEQGKTRKERKAKTYPKMIANGLAIALKLADRIANVENCIKTKSSLLDMYKKEQEVFKKHLYNGKFLAMWVHLEGLIK
jgi:(p)ppGpp synthase/HD superfamily hydrolase